MSAINTGATWPPYDPTMPDDVADLVRSDPSVPGTPAWWLLRLDKALTQRGRGLQIYQDYYAGNHRLAFAQDNYRQRFGALFKAFADNWCSLVVQVAADRLIVQGFRVPVDPEDISPGEDIGVEADSAAWDIWQRNDLDSGSQIAHVESLVNRISYAMVWPDDKGKARVTIEHPQQMITENDPEDRLTVRAAFKRWTDDSQLVYANLYLPDGIYKFSSGSKPQSRTSQIRWEPRFDPDDPRWPVPNRYNEVPVVPLPNEPQLYLEGISEIDQVIPVQDAVNKLMADMLIASEYQSFRQRAIAGIEIPRDPETDEPLTDFYKQMVSKLWLIEDPNAKFWESGQVDLGQYRSAIEVAVNHIASHTQTPPHYFYVSGQFPSGEALKSAEAGLVAKSRRKMLHLGEGWERVIRLAFLMEGDKAKADSESLETIWKNPETRNEAVVADAAVKMLQVGLPEEMIWESLGLSPAQIQRAKALRKAEAAKPAAGDIAPTVFDAVTGQMVERKDPNLRFEAPPGQVETPRPVGGGPAPGTPPPAPAKVPMK